MRMYRMVVLLNPSATIGTYGTDGNLWSRSVKPSLRTIHETYGEASQRVLDYIVRMVTCNHDL